MGETSEYSNDAFPLTTFEMYSLKHVSQQNMKYLDSFRELLQWSQQRTSVSNRTLTCVLPSPILVPLQLRQ